MKTPGRPDYVVVPYTGPCPVKPTRPPYTVPYLGSRVVVRPVGTTAVCDRGVITARFQRFVVVKNDRGSIRQYPLLDYLIERERDDCGGDPDLGGQAGVSPQGARQSIPE